MSDLKITQCKGEGQGSCKMCSDNGKWNINWMCFLYKIEGYDGCYCSDCVERVKTAAKKAENDTFFGIDNMTEEQWRMFDATVE